MKTTTYNNQQHVVIAESKDFELLQSKTYYERCIQQPGYNYESSGLSLLFKGKLIAESGCGCCGDDIVRDEVVKKIEEIVIKE